MPNEGGLAISAITAAGPINAAYAAPGEHRIFGTDATIVEPALPVVVPPPSETPPAEVASAHVAEPAPRYANEAESSLETFDECLVAEICIDRYLFAAYQRAPKVDTIKVPQAVKVTVNKEGKTRTVTKIVEKLVNEDFAWKDPKAAQKAGLSLQDYVIGGMDRSFKLRLYHALRAMEAAGLEPGITSGFRDDYRQSLASGLKAASDRSFHGGSRRGGYGHGLAADVVSVKGETRAQRFSSSQDLWKWVDAHGEEYGIARPYLDKDPPHVGPLDGEEYALKRGRAHATLAGLETSGRHGPAVRDSKVKSVRTAPSKPGNI